MTNKIYRIDKFIVPDHAKEEFLSRVREAHEILRTLPGFVSNIMVEKTAGNGSFNYVTIAEWATPEAIESAKKELDALREVNNFNPQEMLDRLGIQADLAIYKAIDL
ncbi:antibiotic biosynthesis monooxygenase [Thiobacillus sp.]|uniref:antibiotic biosynthesis monooxygenase family protein n=1 Tax=Thiobacillus sp. TaxID=924 RepID=UPI0025D2A072|nr:antibiotic biosynthesis monooxygenase [Thiobacillus sp.]MBT9540246.1 antibiotic biosynthesis monooxygenase [Thiobacillus sp.]